MAHTNKRRHRFCESEVVIIHKNESESSEGATIAHTNHVSVVSVKVKVEQ